MIPIERGVQMLKGERLFKDAETKRVYESVKQGLSISSRDIVQQFRKEKPQERVDINDIEFRLLALIVNGYVLRQGPDSGSSQLFSPTEKALNTSEELRNPSRPDAT